MPDRLFKHIGGLHGGTLVIAGLVYMFLGLSWVTAPTASRLAGIDWIPLVFVNDITVGIVWGLTGTFALVVGMFSKGHRKLTLTAFYASVFVPTLLAIWFAIAFFQGESARTLVTTVSYLGYSALVGWVGSRPDEQVVIK